MKRTHHPRRLAGLLCAVWLSVATAGLFSCSSPAPPPEAATVLAAMQAAAAELPAGQVFTRTSDPSAADWLSDTLFAALFGPAARGWLSDDAEPADISGGAIIQDAALFLSLAPHPAELVVLRCADSASALSAATLCRERLRVLRATWSGTDYAAWVESGQVTVAGTFLLFAVSPEADELLRVGARAVRAG